MESCMIQKTGIRLLVMVLLCGLFSCGTTSAQRKRPGRVRETKTITGNFVGFEAVRSSEEQGNTLCPVHH